MELSSNYFLQVSPILKASLWYSLLSHSLKDSLTDVTLCYPVDVIFSGSIIMQLIFKSIEAVVCD